MLDNQYDVLRLRVNREFTRMFGYPPEEIVGKRLEILVPAERDKESNFIPQRPGSGPDHQRGNHLLPPRRLAGGKSDRGTPIKVSGSPVALYLIYRDITQSKRAERALIESESKFRASAETAATTICIHDNARFLYVNRSGEKMLGYSRAELLRMNPLLLAHPDSREDMRRRGEARQRGAALPSRYELKIVTKSEEVRWLDFNVTSIQFEGKTSPWPPPWTSPSASALRNCRRRCTASPTRPARPPTWKCSTRPSTASWANSMDARNFYVALYDEDTGLLSGGFHGRARPRARPRRKRITEYVMRSGEPQLAPAERFQELVRSGEIEEIGILSVDWLGLTTEVLIPVPLELLIGLFEPAILRRQRVNCHAELTDLERARAPAPNDRNSQQQRLEPRSWKLAKHLNHTSLCRLVKDPLCRPGWRLNSGRLRNRRWLNRRRYGLRPTELILWRRWLSRGLTSGRRRRLGWRDLRSAQAADLGSSVPNGPRRLLRQQLKALVLRREHLAHGPSGQGTRRAIRIGSGDARVLAQSRELDADLTGVRAQIRVRVNQLQVGHQVAEVPRVSLVQGPALTNEPE